MAEEWGKSQGSPPFTSAIQFRSADGSVYAEPVTNDHQIWQDLEEECFQQKEANWMKLQVGQLNKSGSAVE